MTVSDQDLDLSLRRGGEAVWQGVRYITAAVAAALAFALPAALWIALQWGLVVLRLVAGLLTGRYDSILEALAGLLVVPVILAVLAVVAMAAAAALALGMSFGLLTPAALLARLTLGRLKAGGLATGLALLLAGLVGGLVVAVLGHTLVLRVLPEVARGGWGLVRWLVFGAALGGLAGAAYALTLAGLDELRSAARRVAEWLRREQAAAGAVRLGEPTPATLSRVA